MVPPTEDTVALRQDIGLALKTTVRDALALLCDNLFTASNPGKTPYKVLSTSTEACNVLRNKPFLKDSIKKNKIEKLDVTAICVLLRWACGLSSSKCAWKDLTCLEGNIDKLRRLRNDDAHATREGCSKEELEDTWQQLVMAVTNVLQMGGLEDQLARVKQELVNIRKPKLETVADRKVIRESIQRELQELYSCVRKTTLMPLTWAGRNFSFNHHVEKVYTKTRLSTTQDGMLRELDGESMLEDLGASRMIILQGESGTGKTSLLRHYAAAWGGNTPTTLPALSNVDYLIFLDCTAVSTRTFTVSHVIHEILPKTTSRWKPATVVKELTKAGSKVVFLIDAFDKRPDTFRSTFRDLQEKCSKAFFVVTTRPHSTLAITKLCEVESIVVTAHGFTRSSAMKYAKRIFKTFGKANDAHKFFTAISSYDELVTIPQHLCWSSWFWMENGSEHFSKGGKVLASITDFIVRKLCHHSGKQILSGELPREGQRWLSVVARLAFNQAKQDHTLLTESSTEVKELLECAQQLNLRPYEALSSFLQCDSYMTGMGEYNVFHFVHESQANYLAALHVLEVLQSCKTITLTDHLKDMQKDKIKSIALFLVGFIFEIQEEVNTQMIQDIVEICIPYLHSNDISFILDLIEEIGYRCDVIKLLAKHILEHQKKTSPLSTPVSPTSNSKNLYHDHFLLQPKELQRTQSLYMLLSEVKPKQLWLRLSEGLRADDDSPARGHQVVEGDPEAAMRLVSTAYRHSVLPELRLTDLAVVTRLTWPEGLQRLSLERCNIESDPGLCAGLTELSLIDCTCLIDVKYPSSLKSLTLENLSLEEPSLPENVESLELRACSLRKLTFLPSTIKRLSLYQCTNDGELLLPQSLEELTINGILSADPEAVKPQESLQHVSGEYAQRLRRAISSLRNLKYLSISGIDLSPADFISLFLEFQQDHGRAHLLLGSMCKLREKCVERDIILAFVVTSDIQVTVRFGDESFSNANEIISSPG